MFKVTIRCLSLFYARGFDSLNGSPQMEVSRCARGFAECLPRAHVFGVQVLAPLSPLFCGRSYIGAVVLFQHWRTFFAYSGVVSFPVGG